MAPVTNAACIFNSDLQLPSAGGELIKGGSWVPWLEEEQQGVDIVKDGLILGRSSGNWMV